MAGMTQPPRLIVTRDKKAERFELRRHQIGQKDELLGFADYSMNDRVMTVSYVETLIQHRGNGFAAMLMAGLLDDVGVWGLRVNPTSSFAAAYINDQPDMRHLLAS